MEKYVWLFPILFIIHDMEEIIGFSTWLDKNKNMIMKRFPAIYKKIDKSYKHHSTEGMAVAVLEELLLCILFCLISLWCSFYYLWLGGFIAFTLHLFIHIIQSIVIRKYIPALATSVLLLPVSIHLIVRFIGLMSADAFSIILYSLIGAIIIVINLKFAHHLMNKFTVKIEIKKET